MQAFLFQFLSFGCQLFLCEVKLDGPCPSPSRQKLMWHDCTQRLQIGLYVLKGQKTSFQSVASHTFAVRFYDFLHLILLLPSLPYPWANANINKYNPFTWWWFWSSSYLGGKVGHCFSKCLLHSAYYLLQSVGILILDSGGRKITHYNKTWVEEEFSCCLFLIKNNMSRNNIR